VKTILKLSMLTLISFVSFAHADQACKDQVKQKQADLQKVEDRYDEGEATIVEVIDARVGLADQMHTCGQFVKNKFCKFKSDLLNNKIGHLSDADQDAAKKELTDFQAYCLDPKQN
jgi:hypothetical protein